LNGRPNDGKYDVFWAKLGKMLDKHTAVDDRRHGDHLYLPFAISVPDLIRQVEKRLQPDTCIPSESWVRFNFWPSNPYTKNAVHYTGQLKVKLQVQSRLLHAQHDDAHFAAFQFRLLKEMAVKNRNDSVGDPKKTHILNQLALSLDPDSLPWTTTFIYVGQCHL
jgi:hypothetical protein